MKIYDGFTSLIGNTPLVRLKRIENITNSKATILAKLEKANPGGSVKDRVAKHMLEKAIKNGEINKNTTIIEPTSGNTGIGLAAICAERGLKLILTMPETMSIERQKLLKAYGANVVLTAGSEGMSGAINKAKELLQSTKNSFIPSQFDNENNPKAHYEHTGPEIWQDTNGNVDIFVACVGTGGTLTGTSKFLKEKNSNIYIAAVEPLSSALLSGKPAGPHKIQGIGANFIPSILDQNIYNEVVCASDEQAMQYARYMAQKEGLLVGISSGAAVYAASCLAQREENAGKVIVTVLPDTGERYLSTELFD